jgi:hypothetical protein
MACRKLILKNNVNFWHEKVFHKVFCLSEFPLAVSIMAVRNGFGSRPTGDFEEEKLRIDKILTKKSHFKP